MPRKIQFPIGLDPELEEKLNEASREERRSKAEIVRIALREYFKKISEQDKRD